MTPTPELGATVAWPLEESATRQQQSAEDEPLELHPQFPTRQLHLEAETTNTIHSHHLGGQQTTTSRQLQHEQDRERRAYCLG